MSDDAKLDALRGKALQEIDRNRRQFKLALLGAAAFEMLVLVFFLLAMDFDNRLHALLLVGTIGSYTIVVMGLIALGVYLNGGNLRILKALELLKDSLAKDRL